MRYTFRTTLHCQGCVATVAPDLERIPGIRRWSADITHPDKLLTVEADTDVRAAVRAALARHGYMAEPVELPEEMSHS